MHLFIRKKLGLAVAIACSASLFTGAVAAQAVSSDESQVEKVSVWGTQIKASSLYLKRDQIENRQADHLSDLLRFIPGIDVGGAHSLNQRITIRSMDDKDLAISIDGARQNSYMYHHMGNLQIHADILRSVDIEVGTNSVLNGGLGGAVRFETKQASDLLNGDQRFGGRLQFSFGNNGGNNLSATGYGLLGDNGDFLLYHNQVNRDDYEVGGGKILDQDGAVVPDTNGEVVGLEGDQQDTLVKFGWNIDDKQRVQFSYERYTDEGDYSYRPDMGLATDLAITNSLSLPLLWPTELTRDTLTLNYQGSFDDTLIKGTLYSNTSELWRDENGWSQSPIPHLAARAGVNTGEAKNTGFNLLANTEMAQGDISHSLTYGLDYVKYDTDYQSVRAATTLTSEESSSTLALYVEDKLTLSDVWSLTPGVRYERYSADTNLVDDDYNELLFALAVAFQPSDNFVVELSTAQLFQGPEVSEVFTGAGLGDTPNPEMDAETGLNSELSFAYQQPLTAESGFSVGATLFRTDINDYIYDYAPAPAGVNARSWKDNIGDMQIDGIEAYVDYHYNNLKLLLSYSKAESELDAFADYASLNGARLDRQQGNTISFSASYVFADPQLSLNWQAMRVGDVAKGVDLDGAGADNSKDGFTVHNVSARWESQGVEGLTLIAGVDNLFDEFYASQSSRTGTTVHPRFGPLYLLDYEPGRNIKLTLAYQF